MTLTRKSWTTGLVFLVTLACFGAGSAFAQQPTQRQLRTYIPPDQLVSFLPSTPFEQFIDLLNPIFLQETGKTIVDPLPVSGPIGIPVARAHFFDAFELVLHAHKLTFRETDRYFVIERAPEDVPLVQTASEARAGTTPASGASSKLTLPSLGTREIQINAILFELNHTAARDLGIDWNTLFGGEGSGSSSGSGGSGSGGSGSGSQDRPVFRLKTGRLFEGVEDIIEAPEDVTFTTLTQLFRLLENEGVGQTIANPSVTVQSGEEGRIQIGSDIPVQTRDFSGNTITQFFSTGIIINVVPTVITEALADTAGAPTLDFIHLDVEVEKSSSRPSLSGPIIDRNQVSTQVMLLDGEQTGIGGLFSTDEFTSRRGIPILKDLPPWFFGLRYLFGYTQRTLTQKELLIVLQARMLDQIPDRAQRPFQRDLIEKQRRETEENLRRTGVEANMLSTPPQVHTPR